MIKQDPSVNKSCSTGMMYKTSLLQYTYIMEKSEFKKKKGSEICPRIWPGGRPPVDCRSTGKLTGGRVPVDCRSAGQEP